MDKPEVGPIEGAPPADLVIEDITVGEGPEARAGPAGQRALRRGGPLHGRRVRRVLEPGRGFEFPLGGGQVIAGWDQGVVG